MAIARARLSALRPWLVASILVGGWMVSRVQADRAASSSPTAPWRVSVALAGRPKLFQPTPIDIKVTAPTGEPVPVTAVTLRLTMPAMAMPENVATGSPLPGRPGLFRAQATFTMAGDWEVTATARRDALTALGKLRTVVD